MKQAQVIETMSPPDVYLGPSPVHGRGVYAARDFKKNDLVEETPYLHTVQQPLVMDFAFKYGDEFILPLGYGVVYNHSDEENLKFYINPDSETVSFIANQDINMGEELFINYGEDWWKERGYLKIKANPTFLEKAAAFHWRDLLFFAISAAALGLFLYNHFKH